MNVPPYPIVPQLNLRLVTLNRSLFPSAEPATLCSDPFLLLALPFPPPPPLVRSNPLKENIHKTGTMFLLRTSLIDSPCSRSAAQVQNSRPGPLPTSCIENENDKILGERCPVLNLKPVPF